MRRSMVRRVAVLALVAALAAPVAWAGSSARFGGWGVGTVWTSLRAWVVQLWTYDGEGIDPTACAGHCTDEGPESDPFG